MKKTRNESIFEDYQSGMLQREVADKYGVTPQRVTQIAQEEAVLQNVELRKRKSGCASQLPVIPDHLIKAYKLRLLEVKSIARKLKCSTTSVRHRLRKVERVEADLSRREQVYKAYKEGKSITNLSDQFDLDESAVKIYIVLARRGDPKPYYRHVFHKKADYDKKASK